MNNTYLLTSKDIHFTVLQNSVHLLTILCYGFLCTLCMLVVNVSIVGIAITIAIVLFCYVKKLIKNLWFWLILIGCFIFPVVAPFVMVVMVILRLKYLFEHKIAMFYGFLIYLIPLIINYCFTNMESAYYSSNFSLTNYYPSWSYFFVFFLTALIIHFLLVSLYKKGYVLKNAILLMIEFPVLIILLVISIWGIFDGHLFDKPINESPGSDFTSFENPGVHEVKSYVRHGSNGELQFVSSHLRTNPDGILGNNLSYNELIPTLQANKISNNRISNNPTIEN